MKIGVMVESFRLGFRAGVEKAAQLGAAGIQAYATGGELGFATMTPAKAKEALDIVKSNGMVFSAICGDFGYGFDDPARNPEMIEKSKRVIGVAKMLECDIVTTHIHRVPEIECEQKEILRAACTELGRYADSMNSKFALETGPEFGSVLGGFLQSLDTTGVRVNFDPANLVMVAGDRPENALKALGPYVVHTHAKDGIKLRKPAEGELIVGEEALHHAELAKMGHTFLELPLGKGDVDFDIYLPALHAAGFDGFLTIEREVGASPEADIAMAVDFLREKLAKFSL
ncbi:MAG: sugar phosphate isomerase/epimerase [Oscillospiraceae bacterium]|nr:sugar phosphate isomerase/epimerase [Oscillospiraceae bacterium]